MPPAVGNRVVPGLLVLLGMTALAPIWLADPLPLQDLPNHLLKVDLLRRYLADDAHVRALFALDLGPIPNSFCYGLLLLLSRWMTFVMAAKVYLSMCIVGLLAMGFVWVKGRNPDNLLLAVVPAGIVYTTFTTKGFLNYIAAEPMYLGCLALISRHDFRARDGVVLAALAMLLFETHGFVFLALLAATAGFLVLAQHGWHETRRRVTPLLPALVLLGVWVWRTVGLPPAGEPPSTLGWPQLTDPLDFVMETGRWLLGDEWRSGFAALWLAGLATVIGLTAARLWNEIGGLGTLRTTARRHALFLVALGMALAYLLGPDLPARHGAVRWLPLIVLTMLAGLCVPAARPGRMAVGTLLVVGALGLHLKNAEALVAGAGDVREYVAGMALLEPDASVLPIDREDDVTGERVNLHTWAYYHIDHGGWGPRIHAWQGRHPIYYRAHLWAPDENMGPEPLAPDLVDRAAACYDYVVLWDPAGNDGAQLAPRFELVPTTSRLQVWRNRAGVRRRPPLTVPACLDDGGPGPSRS